VEETQQKNNATLVPAIENVKGNLRMAGKEDEMHTKWEYDIQTLPVENQVRVVLNQLGKDGWELIHV
jgi:hypothetical protein